MMQISGGLMHIVLVTETYLPHQNGVVQMVRLTAGELRKRGHRVSIIAPVHYRKPLDEPGLVAIPALPLPGTQGYSFALPTLSQAHRVIAAADLVHTHHPFVLGSWAQRQARAHTLPFVFTHHTRYQAYAHHRFPVAGTLAHQPLTDYIRTFANHCSLVTAPSLDIVEELRAAEVSAPLVHVPNGIDVARFQAGNPARWHAALAPSGQPILLHVGRLAPEKNLRFLLDSILGLSEPVHLVVAGDGPSRSEIEEYAGALKADHRVTFLGAIPHHELHHLYACADLFVTSSVTETHPLVLIEAAAAGLPAIAVESLGTRNVVVDHATGLVARPTTTAFRRALAHLLHRPALRHQYGQAAKTHAADFSIEKSVDRLLDAYALSRRLDHVLVHG